MKNLGKQNNPNYFNKPSKIATLEGIKNNKLKKLTYTNMDR